MSTTITREKIIAQIKARIYKRPNTSVLDLCKPLDGAKPVATMDFIRDNIICTRCGHVEEKSSWCIAQAAMRHKVRFVCRCGNIIPC